MNKFYILSIVLVIISCKRNNDVTSANASIVNFFVFGDSKLVIDSAIVNSMTDENLKAFYITHEYKTAWNKKEHRDFIINEIENAENDGLESKDYNYYKIKYYEEKYDDLEDSIIIKYDFLLTESSHKYIKHISKGKLDPKKLYKDWDIPVKEVDVNKILSECIDQNNFKEAIENCKPQHLIYKKLKSALKRLREFPDISYGVIDLKERIIPNKKNKNVPAVKKMMMFWGDMKEKDTILNTLYDKTTQDAVKLFQARHGLNPDAVIGRSTIEALNYSRNQRIEQVIANMERWRWYAHDFGEHYLLINIPDYNIVAVKEDDTIQNQRVVVGKETRRTPILESKISNINLNPNWTVPPTILKEDIYPEAIKDRSVFKKKGLTILNNKNQEISPWSWKIEDANKYKYVQNPSRENSLGSMKINFPNKYSVYLHDTNHRDYFAFTYRSLSSGCVRLEKPLEMAAYILNDEENWPLEKIQDTTDIKHYIELQKKREKEIAKKRAKLLAKDPTLVFEKRNPPKPELKTIVVKVKDSILIHQLYWTAWENNGTLQFREDIYCYDLDLYSKLRY